MVRCRCGCSGSQLAAPSLERRRPGVRLASQVQRVEHPIVEAGIGFLSVGWFDGQRGGHGLAQRWRRRADFEGWIIIDRERRNLVDWQLTGGIYSLTADKDDPAREIKAPVGKFNLYAHPVDAKAYPEKLLEETAEIKRGRELGRTIERAADRFMHGNKAEQDAAYQVLLQHGRSVFVYLPRTGKIKDLDFKKRQEKLWQEIHALMRKRKPR